MHRLLTIILLFSINCASAKKEISTKQTSTTLKIDVVFVKEIKGTVLQIPIRSPYGLAVDFQKNIYLSDAGNNRIIKFDQDLNPKTQIGGFGSGDGQFNTPTFISFDNGLNMMVSDERNQRVARYNSQLTYVDELKFEDEDDLLKFGYPSGLSFTSYGEVWVADRENNQLVIFNNVGQFSHTVGEYGASGGQLQSPEKIVKNQFDNFYVCDAGNKRIVTYDSFGSYKSSISHDEFSYPISIFLKEHKIFVLDSDLGSIFCLDINGQMLAEIRSPFLGDKTQFLNPSDMIFIAPDKILISDTGNDRLVLGKLIIEE